MTFDLQVLLFALRGFIGIESQKEVIEIVAEVER